jgi:alpha-L-rhamnosidase
VAERAPRFLVSTAPRERAPTRSLPHGALGYARHIRLHERRFLGRARIAPAHFERREAHPLPGGQHALASSPLDVHRSAPHRDAHSIRHVLYGEDRSDHAHGDIVREDLPPARTARHDFEASAARIEREHHAMRVLRARRDPRARIEIDVGDDGSVPDVFPKFSFPRLSDTAWMAQRILIPWEVYMAMGDKDVLAKHYDKMKLAITYLQAVAGADYLGTPAANGDWVAAGATEDKVFFADAYYYRNVATMAQIAGELGNPSDQAVFQTLAEKIRDAFNAKYLKSNSHYGNNTQSGNAVALDFDIVPPDARDNVLNSMVNKIRSNNDHVTTGILGTKAMMQALWAGGRSDIAYMLMNQTTYPSWGYMLSKGPGTLWERWDSDNEVGSGMNSFNHVMFGGGPAAWVYKGVAGISPTKPGYAEILIKPELVGDLVTASGSVKTTRGVVSTAWTKVGGSEVDLDVTIPPNSKAVVHVPTPGSANVRIKEGGVVIYDGAFVSGVAGITGVHATSESSIAFDVGSGTYEFVATNN